MLLALAALELAPFPPWRWRDVLPTRAHRWLASQPGPLRVLDCAPASRASDALAVPLLGHEGSLLGAPPLEDCGEPRLGGKLKAMGYTHAVVRAGSPEARWLDGQAASGGLARGPRFEDGWILNVSAEPPRAFVSALHGFHPREYGEQETWRWMAQTGALTVVAAAGPVEAVLELQLKAFPGDRRFAWFLNGRRRGEAQVGAAWSRHELALGTLDGGENTVTLACLEPGMVANAVLRNGDVRTLALAVGDWSVRSVQN